MTHLDTYDDNVYNYNHFNHCQVCLGDGGHIWSLSGPLLGGSHGRSGIVIVIIIGIINIIVGIVTTVLHIIMVIPRSVARTQSCTSMR